MTTITITQDGEPVANYSTPKRYESSKALVAIVNALDALPEAPKPRKQRSDAGKTRETNV